MQRQKILYRSDDLRMTYGNFSVPDLSGYNRPFLHSHNSFCELLCIFRGKGDIHVEGNRYTITDGSFMLIRPLEPHYMSLDPTGAYERAVIHFSPAILDSIDPERMLLRPFFQREAGEKNQYIPMDSACMELVQKTLEKPDRLNILLGLIGLLQHFGTLFDQGATTPTQQTPEHKILRYIRQHPQENYTTESLCAKFFISRTQLYRRFKTATGTSVGEYINLCRARMAQKLIQQGHKPSQVFAQCGFQDYSTFFRAYRKHIGHNPTQELQTK